MKKKTNVQFLVIILLFVFSGIAGLMYQVVWFKHLSYFLGNTTYSQVVVLATFMGGLAIGAWWWGKKADKSKNTLRLFAWLEILIALYCFLYFPIFEVIKKGFVTLVTNQGWSSDSSLVLLLKLLVSALTILLPTILMGGTLPVLVKYLSGRITEVGKNVSILYFINSLGAVLGTILAGFYLIQTVGLRATVYVGATADLVIGLFFLIATYGIFKNHNKIIPKKRENNNRQEEIESEKFLVNKKQQKIIILIAGISGMCAMIYEIIWLRLLIPILSSTTYSFSLILAVFITGITIGSLLIYFILPRLKQPFLFLGLCQLFIALSVMVTLSFYEKIPYLIWSSNAPGESTYNWYLFTQVFYISLIMIVPTIFLGMTLPIASRLVVNKVSKSGSAVGKVFSINTIGTVAGSILSGLILIPIIGIKSTIDFAIILNVIMFLLILVYNVKIDIKLKYSALLLLLLVSIYYVKSISDETWSYSIMTSEVSRKVNRKKAPDSFKEFMKIQSNHEKILYYKEGVSGTFVVGAQGDNVYLYTNGKGDANSVDDLRTQVSLAQTPMILHPEPDSIFVIGFGAGTTIGNVLTHENVKYAEVAEISPEVIEASETFNHVNQKPLKDPRLKVIQDDGVSALRLSKNKYDIIISQPSNPWSAGVGNLFTKEFFKDCKAKLKKGGYVAQWFNLYEMTDENLKIILKTIKSEFPYISLWQIGRNDILILGSENEFQFNLDLMYKKYLKVDHILSDVKISSFYTFLSQQYLSNDNNKSLNDYIEGAPLNTENLPLLEYKTPYAYYMNSIPKGFKTLDERDDLYNSDLLLKKEWQKNEFHSDLDIFYLGMYQTTSGNEKFGFSLAEKNPLIYIAWGKKMLNNNDYKNATEYFKKALAVDPSLIEAYSGVYQSYLLQGEQKNAFRFLNEKILSSTEEISIDLRHLRANSLFELKQYDLAKKEFLKLIEDNPEQLKYYKKLALIYAKEKDFQKVVELMNESIEISQDAELFYNRGSAFFVLKKYQEAINDFSKAININPSYGKAYFGRGRCYLFQENITKACQDWKRSENLGVKSAAPLILQYCK